MSEFLSEEELWLIPAADTHCHHLHSSAFTGLSLHQLLQMTYVSWLIPDPGDTPEGNAVYFSKMKANSYFYWWRRGIERLYGDGRALTQENWAWYDERVRRAYRDAPQHDIGLLRDACRYRAILLDDYTAPGSDHGLPQLMRPVFRCDMFLCGHCPGQTDENHNHAYDYFETQPTTLEEYVQQTEQAVAAAVRRGAVGLKIAIAYERTLDFVPDSREDALRAFGDPEATPAQKKAFGDYMMFRLAEIAARLDVPIQIHTGLGGLSGSRACGLRELIDANPATKFDLFHASYPWCDDVLGLANNYPNVYVDLCWLPLLSTTRAVTFLRETLELIQSDRILWGCDTWTSEESCGARMAVHHCLLTVLNQLIREGTYTHDDALACARGILYDNAAALYRLDESR